MAGLVTYELDGSIATITMDDGKVNALSRRMLAELNEALDRAEAAAAVVLLTGRAGVFSAGFDLKVLQAGGADAIALLRSGFQTSERLLAFPRPVVVACTGHAIAMGAFLLLSGDYRIGTAGAYKLVANEVAIGMTMPRTACEILRQRLAPAYFTRATILAEPFSPETGLESGFVDRVVAAGELLGTARAVATTLAALDRTAHEQTKLRARAQTLTAMRAAIDADEVDLWRLTGAAA